MTREKLELLHEELAGLQSAANHLGYTSDKMPEIYTVVAALTPTLLPVVPKVIAYANDLTRRHHA